jgi:hypothetical protein
MKEHTKSSTNILEVKANEEDEKEVERITRTNLN